MSRKTTKNIPDVPRIGDAPGTVSVGCRLPAGLRVHVAGHGDLVFKGTNDPRALALRDEYGYHGITSGVPAAAWDALTEQYAKAKWLTSGAIFAARKVADVLAEANEKADENAGFDPIDPTNLPKGIEAAG